MERVNSYSDIQIIQGADLSHSITFDSEFDVDNYTWVAKIGKDRKATSFTGPKYESSDWGSGSVTSVPVTVVKTLDTQLELKLSGDVTAYFEDDFEGVWDLYSKANSGGLIVRQIEGDVLVSSGVVQSDSDTFSAV